MADLTVQQRIAIWESIPENLRNGETDEFIDALIARIRELESEVEDLGYELLERGEYND